MDTEQDIFECVDERVERLISRRLDGEISSAESAELDRALAADPAARALFDDYREGDRLATAALREDVGASRHAPSYSRFRDWRFAVAGAVLTAAAVVALSFLSVFRPTGPRVAENNRRFPPRVTDQQVPRMESPFVEYRNVDFRPRQRLGDVRRELIGIRGDDPNTIYVIERRTQSTRIVPVSGDF